MATLLKKMLASSALPVFFTLFGVIISSYFSWLGNYQSSQLAYKTSCIARTDQQEALLREKYSHFLRALTTFSMSPELIDDIDEKQFRKLASPLAVTAMDMTAYTPEPLTEVALNVTTALIVAMNAFGDPVKEDQAIRAAMQSSKGSYSAYHSALDELERQRRNCD